MEEQNLPTLKICDNCGACLVGGYWKTPILNKDGTRSMESKLEDPRKLSARVCSLSVNQTDERRAKCQNPFKGDIAPDSEFGWPKWDELDKKFLPIFNHYRLLHGLPPVPYMFQSKTNLKARFRAFVLKTLEFFGI